MSTPSAPSTPELVAATHCAIGEGPIWHAETGLLYFFDIGNGDIFAYDPSTGKHRLLSQGPVTGAIVPHADGSLILLQEGGAARLDASGRQTPLADGLCPGNERFNDALVDPVGRIFAGGYGGNASLVRIDLDGRATRLFDGVGVPNGMGFTPDLKHLYFTDTIPHEIYLFDYDQASGALSNRRVFAKIDPADGIPDGMTMDAQGHLWTAIWFGGRLKRFAPDGKLERELHFPVRQTSAVTFGGPDLQDMYVTTTATNGADFMAPKNHDFKQPRGGGLYRTRVPGVRGVKGFRAKVKFARHDSR